MLAMGNDDNHDYSSIQFNGFVIFVVSVQIICCFFSIRVTINVQLTEEEIHHAAGVIKEAAQKVLNWVLFFKMAVHWEWELHLLHCAVITKHHEKISCLDNSTIAVSMIRGSCKYSVITIRKSRNNDSSCKEYNFNNYSCNIIKKYCTVYNLFVVSLWI